MRKAALIIPVSMMLFAGAIRADGDSTSHDGPFAASSLAQGQRGTPNGSLTGGTLRLDPMLPAGGGVSASAQLLLVGSVGQMTVAPSSGAQFILRPGFWTPLDAIAADRIFFDSFE